jgi:acetyl-CoA carboxylase carboxyltransferase component
MRTILFAAAAMLVAAPLASQRPEAESQDHLTAVRGRMLEQMREMRQTESGPHMMMQQHQEPAEAALARLEHLLDQGVPVRRALQQVRSERHPPEHAQHGRMPQHAAGRETAMARVEQLVAQGVPVQAAMQQARNERRQGHASQGRRPEHADGRRGEAQDRRGAAPQRTHAKGVRPSQSRGGQGRGPR